MKAVVALLLAVGSPVMAGVYGPHEPCPFEVAGGVAKPLPHPEFKSLRNDRIAELNPKSSEADEIDTPAGKRSLLTARGRAMARVRELSARVRELSPADRLALSADLVRTGTLGKEFAALKQLTRERPNDFLLAANYVHAETLTGNWAVAARNFEDHVLDLDPPTALPGTPADRLAWMVAVDRTYYRKWLGLREADADPRRKRSLEDAVVYPLFPGVTFTGEELSDAEKAKLPADAVAVAQQLALWSPNDTGLLWLLAEVYAATGRTREAADAFDMCTWGAAMTGPKQLMAHRRVTKAAADKLSVPEPEPDEDGLFAVIPRDKLLIFGGVFAVLALALLTLQIRSWCRPRGRSSG